MRKVIYFLVSCMFVSLFIVFTNNIARADTLQAIGRVKFKLNLSTSTNFIGANKAFDLNYKGQGSYVVVIDSGVDSNSPFLLNKVVLEACFAVKCPDGSRRMVGPGAAKPVHWHGTHVAGIVAGSNSTMRGVAPDVKIIAINIFDSLGSTYDDLIISALNWVDSISSEYNIAAVNMSLGTPFVFRSSCNNYIPALTSVISTLKSKDIATVVSSGNSFSYGMGSPACITDTVSVAATYSDVNEVTKFSNIHEDTDFSAPGNNIYSSDSSGSYRFASGTSMSAPHVAGAFAVYRSKFGVQSVDKVIQDFQNSSVPALDAYTKIVSKRIDLTYLFSNSGTPTTTTTTTLPSVKDPPTTTTTVYIAPKPPDEDVEFGLTVPEILNIQKYKYNDSYIYLDFRYTSKLSDVSKYIFECTYISSVNYSRTLPNKGHSLSLYLVKISSLGIDSCRMAAVSKSGVVGSYTGYYKLK